MGWQYRALKFQPGEILAKAGIHFPPGGAVDSWLGERMQKLGADGWELVTALQTGTHLGTNDFILLFKRPGSPSAEVVAGEPSDAGWHPDPHGVHQLRYWDGTVWTSHVSDDGVQATDEPQKPDGVDDVLLEEA